MSYMKLDIAYKVSRLSKHASILGAECLKGIVQIFKFTYSHGLPYTIYLTILDIKWISDMEKI